MNIEIQIGAKVKLKNSRSNQIGIVSGVLEEDIFYIDSNGNNIKFASKGDLVVKFSFHESEGSFSFFSKSELKNVE